MLPRQVIQQVGDLPSGLGAPYGLASLENFIVSIILQTLYGK